VVHARLSPKKTMSKVNSVPCFLLLLEQGFGRGRRRRIVDKCCALSGALPCASDKGGNMEGI
jgi:hypothetical protein